MSMVGHRFKFVHTLKLCILKDVLRPTNLISGHQLHLVHEEAGSEGAQKKPPRGLTQRSSLPSPKYFTARWKQNKSTTSSLSASLEGLKFKDIAIINVQHPMSLFRLQLNISLAFSLLHICVRVPHDDKSYATSLFWCASASVYVFTGCTQYFNRN